MKTILPLLLFPFLLVSCFQEESTYTLNPDGSGKVEFQATFPLDSMINLGGERPERTPEQKAKSAVANIFENSQGVSAWKDVSYKVTDEGEIQFRGTAYFDDLNRLELKMGGFDSNVLTPSWSVENGTVTVKCALSDDDKPAKAKNKKPAWSEMTPKQQKLAMAKARRGMMQMKGMLGGIAGEMSTTRTFRLPAAAKQSTGFKKTGDKQFSVAQSGEMMLKGIDKVLADEKLMQRLAVDFDLKESPPAEVMQQVFGISADPSVSFPASAAPAFDYKKELAAAQKAAPAMMKKLGLAAVPMAPMAGEAQFKYIRVTGLRVVAPSADRDVRAFNWTAGTAVALTAKLPGAVISADGGKIKKFTLNNGQDLLPREAGNREPRSIDLSADGTLLGFEVQSEQLPEPGATSIAALQGEVVCMAAGGTKVTDLAFPRLEKGAKGKHYGAEITGIEESKYNEGKKEVSIRFDLNKDLIKDVKFFDGKGVQLESRRNGYSWSGNSGRMTYLCEGDLPADGSVKIELYTDVKKHVMPFSLENLPLIPASPKAN